MVSHLIQIERLSLFLLAGWLLTVTGCTPAESAESARVGVAKDSVQVTRLDPEEVAQRADSVPASSDDSGG